MPAKHEGNDGHQPVRVSEVAVRDASNQCNENQNDQRVEGPFAHRLGQAALLAKKGLHAFQLRTRTSGWTHKPAPAHGPFRGLDPQPMHNGGRQGSHPQPLVQTVHLVQSAHWRLDGHWTYRQHHRHRHGRESEQARQQDPFVTHRKNFAQKEDLPVRSQPDSHHDRHSRHQRPTYPVHSDHLEGHFSKHARLSPKWQTLFHRNMMSVKRWGEEPSRIPLPRPVSGVPALPVNPVNLIARLHRYAAELTFDARADS